MKLKTFSFATLIVGLLSLMVSIAVPVIVFCTAVHGAATGIVGGADAPTYRFIISRLLNGWPICLMLAGVSLTITSLFCLVFTKTVKEHCSVKASVISLGLSAVGAMGLVCWIIWYAIVAFQETAKHPIAHPASVAGGAICFGIMILLAAGYCQVRKRQWSWKGVVIDVFTSILYLPFFFFGFLYLSSMIR